MDRLHALVGGEHELAEVGRELRAAVRALGGSGAGAMLVTCSDESEYECADAFQRTFAHETLPRLKYGERVPFRIANPGARYEWGSVRIAEDHFATAEAQRGFKVMVVKINGHVAVVQGDAGSVRFGRMDRYGDASTYCGAVHALFEDCDLPFARDLLEDLRSEGRDRLTPLRAPELMEDGRHALFGAVSCARLQARRCVLDIQDHTPRGPTLYVVMHGVTLNRPAQDTELVGGIYVLDQRTHARHESYHGLGDDPAAYELQRDSGRLGMTDGGSTLTRAPRDHRALARTRLQALAPGARALGAQAAGLLGRLRGEQGSGSAVDRAVLRTMLGAVAATSPVAAALLLLAEGAVGIHHALKLHQAVDDDTQAALAREVLEAAIPRLEQLTPERAAQVVDALGREFPEVQA